MPRKHVFLLSPAYCGGRRAAMLLRDGSSLDIAVRLRDERLTIADAFAFMSGLYFRGKITYARAFAEGTASILVITPTRGLVSPDIVVTADLLREFASVDIGLRDQRYRAPLERDVSALAAGLSGDARIVLLGSVATGKYAEILAHAFGERLVYPEDFIGRGDMSRGGLLLRSADDRRELPYVVLDPSQPRRGPRPPKLAARSRRNSHM